MPIRPENKALYPANWKEISRSVRAEAGDKCETCGVPNKARILRFTDGDRPMFVTIDGDLHDAQTGKQIGQGCFGDHTESDFITVVLTVAHLNHDPRDNRRENLRALCQFHHFRHDQQHHLEQWAANAAKKVGQTSLL